MKSVGLLIVFSLISTLNVITAAPDVREGIRISEVSLDVSKSETTFEWVEISTPINNVSVADVTVVIYGASRMKYCIPKSFTM